MPVQKKLNPAKAYNLFYTTETPIRKPILSLPKLERDDIGVSIRLAIELLRKTFRLYELPLKIGLLIFEKYSQVKEKIEFVYNFIIQGYEVLMESVESASRDNWDRSLIDWISIYDTAEKESNYHASRVHFAVTSKGKKKYMSPKHISQTKPRIKKFINKYKKYVPFYELFVDFILYISEKDPQIHKISREMELNYMREKIPQLLDNYKNTLIEVQGNTKGIFKRQDKHNSNYTKKEGSNSNYYQYVEFRHPNK